jgi:hypothetical protein
MRVALHWITFTAITLAYLAGASSVGAAERFRQLGAREIRSLVIGKAVTDGAHWSDHFYPDGKMKSIELGQTKHGIWKLEDKALCMTRPLVKGRVDTECNEIWLSGKHVEYRRDGVKILEGELKDQW